MRTYNFVICCLFFITSGLNAQDYLVSDISSYTAEYSGKYKIILDEVRRSDDLSTEQQIQLFETRLNKLKADFKTARTTEYNSKSITLSVSHSCTSKASGDKKNCGWRSVYAPISELYTKREWLTVEGDNKGLKINSDGTEASIKMTVAGKGRNRGNFAPPFATDHQASKSSSSVKPHFYSLR